MTRRTKRQQIREAIAAERGPIEPVKKPRKKRKPMTEEQKKAAAERLAKAREKRMANSAGPKHVHSSVLERGEDDLLNYKNVREWQKSIKAQISSEKAKVRANPKSSIKMLNNLEYYNRCIERYFATGDWIHDRYGENMEGLMQRVCVGLGYHHTGEFKGMVKRDVGVVYPDLGYIVWTQEMHDEYYGKPDLAPRISKKRRPRKKK